MEDNNFKRDRTGKIAISAGIAFFIFVIAIYTINFLKSPISNDPSHWGVLGDFVGGIANPLLGLVTIWLLTVSLRQNNEILEQARNELKLAVEELKTNQKIQAATENALQTQILNSEKTMDLNNAIALYETLEKKLQYIESEEPGFKSRRVIGTTDEKFHFPDGQRYDDYKSATYLRNQLICILEEEHERLRQKYVRPNNK